IHSERLRAEARRAADTLLLAATVAAGRHSAVALPPVCRPGPKCDDCCSCRTPGIRRGGAKARGKVRRMFVSRIADCSSDFEKGRAGAIPAFALVPGHAHPRIC